MLRNLGNLQIHLNRLLPKPLSFNRQLYPLFANASDKGRFQISGGEAVRDAMQRWRW